MKIIILFLLFVESQRNSSESPILLWLNGGPGCSSLDGLLNELGPYLINDDGVTLTLNPYAWNHDANILFLEAPAGVGYSYSSDGNVTTNDDQTSLDNYEALKQFFTQFPQFRKNEFYVGGESYGGVYIPTLASRIIDGNSSFGLNFKGIYIGNGMVDFELNTDALVHFAQGHGILGLKQWDWLEKVCCKGCADSCPFHSLKQDDCKHMVAQINHEAWMGGLNPYDMFADCYMPSVLSNSRAFTNLIGLAPKYLANRTKAAMQYLESLKKISPNYVKDLLKLREPTDVGLAPPCIDDTAMVNYMNQKDVRKALYIPPSVGKWDLCSSQVGMVYQQQTINVYKQVKQVLDAGLRVLLYYGDTDMACNFLMGERFAKNLQLKLIGEKRSWHYKKQVAGFATSYENLDFLTVKGAGHMVPQWRRGQAYQMINRFLQKKPY